jgi:hypothetical protein
VFGIDAGVGIATPEPLYLVNNDVNNDLYRSTRCETCLDILESMDFSDLVIMARTESNAVRDPMNDTLIILVLVVP